MSTLHPLSHGTPLSEFDIFSVPPTQLSVKEDVETEHRPSVPISVDRVVQFEFVTAPNEYVKWSECELYIKMRFQLVPKGDLKINAQSWTNLDIEQNFMHSLIQSLDLSINGRLVTKSSINYAYRAYIDNLIGYTKAAKLGHLSSIWWDEQSIAKFAPESSSSDQTKGEYFELRGKLCMDLAQQGRAMLGGLNYKLEFRLNKPEFAINVLAGSNLEVAYDIETISLLVHRSLVTEGTLVAHFRALKHATAKYPITRHEIQAVSINRGVMDVMLERIFSGQIPRRILVGFVNAEGYRGHYQRSPFLFQNFDISQLSFTVDGIAYPRTPYTPVFSKKHYMREYYSFLQAFNQDSPSPTLELSYENYASDKVFFAYNFAPDLGDGCGFGGHLNLLKFGSLGLHIRFSKATPESLIAILFAEFDNLIQIDENLQVNTDYIV
jgi:hypothetical protein